MEPLVPADIIEGFIAEARPLAVIVGTGFIELSMPVRDGVVIGQAAQSLRTIRNAGSALMLDDLVALSTILSDTLALVANDPDHFADHAQVVQPSLTGMLDQYLTALSRGDDPAPIVAEAHGTFRALALRTGDLHLAAKISDPDELDAFFGEVPKRTSAGARDHNLAELSSHPEVQPIAFAPYRTPARDSDAPASTMIFADEFERLIQSLGVHARAIGIDPGNTTVIDQLRDDARSIYEAASVAGYPIIGRIGIAVDEALKAHVERQVDVDRDTLELLLVAWKMLRAISRQFNNLARFDAPSKAIAQRSASIRQAIDALCPAPDGDQIVDDQAGHKFVEIKARSAGSTGNPTPVSPIADLRVVDKSVEPNFAPISGSTKTVYAQHDPVFVDADTFSVFDAECAQLLDRLTRAAIQLEQHPSAIEPAARLKRTLHSLKGAATAAEMEEIAALCHRCEEMIAGGESDSTEMQPVVVAELFQTIENIDAALESRRSALSTLTDRTRDMYPPNAGSESFLIDAARLNHLLQSVDNLEENYLGIEQRIEFVFSTLAKLQNSVQQMAEIRQTFDRLVNEIDFSDPIAPKDGGGIQISSSGAISDNLDGTTQGGEGEILHLSRRLNVVNTALEESVATAVVLKEELAVIVHQHRQLKSSLQSDLMSLSAVSFALIVPQLRQTVRIVANTRWKKVDLVVEGEEVRVEKLLMDALYEPLAHLLRNAIDHGIELPDVRLQAGKPENGTVIIRASREGDEIVVSIIDDGAGINVQRVIECARNLGEVVPEGISVKESTHLIFISGVTSSLHADMTSGRGIGMNIVQRFVEQFNGRIAVDSRPGVGTSFSIRLPSCSVIA